MKDEIMMNWFEKSVESFLTKSGNKKGSYNDSSLRENGLLSYERNGWHWG